VSGSRRCPGCPDPGGVQGVRTPALLITVPFLKRTYFQNMSFYSNERKTYKSTIVDFLQLKCESFSRSGLQLQCQ